MKALSLDRILQSQGIGSRKWCRELISTGEVVVNGELVTDYKRSFAVEGLKFSLFGEEWLYREHVYIALNKPGGYECSRKPSHHPGVLTLLPDEHAWRDVQAVGRLDHDTTGLLLLSDDGAFIHAQSSPKRHVPKVYLATTAEPASEQLISKMLTGVQLHDEPLPLAAVVCRKISDYQLEIVLEQGKYHQVKRMLAAAGNHCTALHRSAIGFLQLTELNLEEGEWRYLEQTDLEKLIPMETVVYELDPMSAKDAAC
jgi:16S rRNA pseudouridine516 synthase